MILIHNGKNISSRYHGERPLMAKYHGDKLVWLKENDWRNQYQQVEYIESTGTQYINTGFPLSTKARIETVISYPTQTVDSWLNGLTNQSSSDLHRFFWGISGAYNGFIIGVNNNIIQTSQRDNLAHKYIIDNKSHLAYFDENQYSIQSNIETKNLYLSAVNFDENNNPGLFSSNRLYSFVAYENDEVKMNLIPVYRRKDGVAGMYDIVNKKFYKSETSTEFNAGKEIVGRLPYGFTEVEYIEGTGQQYINTGYIVNENSRVEMDITFTGYFDGEAQHNGVITRTPYTSRFYYGQGVSGTDTVITLGIDSYNIVKVTDTDIHNAVLDNKELKGYFDLTEYTFSSRFKNGNLSFYLGALNDDGKVNYYCHEKIYAFNIKEGDNVIMNLIPVYRRKDGVAGMYDIVNKKFYKSETSTEFNAGKEIVGRLPYGFTEVEYIEGTGNSYINLGLLPKTTHSFSSRFIVTDKSSANNMIIGTRGTGNFDTSRNQIYMNRQKVDKQVVLRNIYNVNDVKLTEGSDGYYSFDNVKNANAVLEGTTIPYYLFAINKLGVADAIANLKMYYFTIKDNGKVVCDLIPCIRESDGVAGMYNMIGGKFYKSETETEFNAGRKVIVRLPEEYQEVEYIKSNGTSWINTGYIPNGNTKVEVSLSYEIQTGLGAYFLGARQSWKVKDYTLSTGRNSKLEKWGYLFNNYGTSGLQTEEYVSGGEKHLLVKDKNKIYHNGVLVSTATAETFDSGIPMYLFNINAKEQAVGNAPMVGEMYYCKIYDNGTIIRNFIPCIRKKDNIAGMYDTIGKKFYKSETLTEFVAGPIASGEQLEFISNPSYNHIDLGYFGNLNTEIETLFKPLSVKNISSQNPDYSQICGFTSEGAIPPAITISVNIKGGKNNASRFGNAVYQNNLNYGNVLVNAMMNKDKLVLNDKTFTLGERNNFTSLSMYLFGANNLDHRMNMELYNFIIKETGNVKMSLLPCKINGEIGLLDTVSKVFFTGELYGKPFISN